MRHLSFEEALALYSAPTPGSELMDAEQAWVRQTLLTKGLDVSTSPAVTEMLGQHKAVQP